MRIPWTCVFEQLRPIKIYMLSYTQYSPWIFSGGNRNDNYPPTLLGNILCVQKNTNKARNAKCKKQRAKCFAFNSRVTNRFFSPHLKICIIFYLMQHELTYWQFRRVSLWRDSRKKKITGVCVGLSSSRQCESKYLGIWTRMLPKVLSAALVPHVSVKFIECTRRFRRQHYLPLKYSITCVIICMHHD